MQIKIDKYGRVYTGERFLSRVIPEQCSKCASARMNEIQYDVPRQYTVGWNGTGNGTDDPRWNCLDCGARVWWDSTGPCGPDPDGTHVNKGHTRERIAQNRARESGLLPKPRAKRRPRRCPDCGGTRVVPIFYGEPTLDNFTKAQAGKAVIGSCVTSGDDPRWECIDCGEQIWQPTEQTAD